jgi:hypothetical protein
MKKCADCGKVLNDPIHDNLPKPGNHVFAVQTAYRIPLFTPTVIVVAYPAAPDVDAK